MTFSIELKRIRRLIFFLEEKILIFPFQIVRQTFFSRSNRNFHDPKFELRLEKEKKSKKFRWKKWKTNVFHLHHKDHREFCLRNRCKTLDDLRQELLNVWHVDLDLALWESTWEKGKIFVSNSTNNEPTKSKEKKKKFNSKVTNSTDWSKIEPFQNAVVF